MKQIDFLREQIVESRTFVNRLISELPKELWYEIPENTDSNFIWQIGHLLISQNFHAITCITGRNSKVSDLIPIADYVRIFNGMGVLHRSVDKDIILPSELIEQFNAVNEICIENLSRLDDDILSHELEPIPFKHPVANTKYDALSWCFKHEMWHSAEMEAIKLALKHPIVWMK
ncbi:DinB family protein [Dysgonomonas sp. 511]|uniref:DinB family protein n=1 Tax=Dysgonomonas sp. 511 TaxID=2302930 RepID=UPI0013D4F7B5|nr:DinB family protein [Dysgonomonas sp. 511]NDV80225.1 DinB family protein [Dysgonomonas sp. 511]